MTRRVVNVWWTVSVKYITVSFWNSQFIPSVEKNNNYILIYNLLSFCHVMQLNNSIKILLKIDWLFPQPDNDNIFYTNVSSQYLVNNTSNQILTKSLPLFVLVLL